MLSRREGSGVDEGERAEDRRRHRNDEEGLYSRQRLPQSTRPDRPIREKEWCIIYEATIGEETS